MANDHEKSGSEVAEKLEKAILELLAERTVGASVCPSKAARRVQPDDWRTLMDATRDVAARLAAGGMI